MLTSRFAHFLRVEEVTEQSYTHLLRVEGVVPLRHGDLQRRAPQVEEVEPMRPGAARPLPVECVELSRGRMLTSELRKQGYGGLLLCDVVDLLWA